MYINYSPVDTVSYEVSSDVNMFHPRVGMWVVSARDGALVVAEKCGRVGLGEAEFGEKRAEPDDLARAMRARNIFGLARR